MPPPPVHKHPPAPMPDDDLPIVDAHHHLWDLSGTLKYPWLFSTEHGYLGDYTRLARDYLPAEFRRDSALHNVIGTVHIEAECERNPIAQLGETAWLTGIAEKHGMPNAIIGHAWIDTPEAEEVLAGHKKFPLVRGIRTKPVTASSPDQSVAGQPRSIQDPKWRASLALLTKYDLSWDLRVPWWHLEEVSEVVAEHPNMRIVLNHTGYPLHRTPEALAGWRRGMEKLAAYPNVHCKISGLTVRGAAWTFEANAPIIRDTISIFGVNRCMFASNFPVDGVKASWDHIFVSFKRAVADFPLVDRKKLFAENALSFYRMNIT